jgi:hypothetical protein
MITEAQNQAGPIPEEVVLQHALEGLAQVQVFTGDHFGR